MVKLESHNASALKRGSLKLDDFASIANKPSVHWDSTNNSGSSSVSANQVNDPDDILVPDLYNLILALNRDCGFDMLFGNLVEIFETHFGAQRLSISVPRDATDIINIPWGLKGLWNKYEAIPHEPVFTVNEKEAPDTKEAEKQSPQEHRHLQHDEDDAWDTDSESDEEDGHGEMEGAETETTNGNESHPMFRTESFRKKFSLTRKLSLKKASRSPTASIASVPSSPVERDSARDSFDDLNVTRHTHSRIFESIRTLEWEEDPLIDAQGVLSVLDSDQLVMLQRRYVTSPFGAKPPCSRQSSKKPVKERFYDTEQATVSPWSRSPAPSPAVRENNDNPFFNQTSEMDRAFDDPTPNEMHSATRPVDAIGYEDTYSIIHILLIVPPKLGSTSAIRSAPLAILSFMSSLIPFPGKLRGVIDKLAPHIATAYVQACAHSNMVKLVTSTKTKHPTAIRNMSPARSFGGSALKASSGFESLEHTSRFYSSLREDFGEDGLTTKQLEILADGDSLPRSRRSSIDQRSAFARRRYRVRPHIRRLLHSYGASFMAEPEKYEGATRRSTRSSEESDQAASQKRRSGTASSAFEMPIPSNKLLRTIIDAIPAHVFMAEPTQGNVTWVSNRTLAFRGQTAEEFMTDPYACIHPEDLQGYIDAWSDALEKGEPLSRMVQVRRFDGRYRAFFMRAVPLRDERGAVMHWLCTLMDFHKERMSQLEALRHAHETAGEQKYKSLAESTPIIVFTTHPSKGVQYANNKWFDYSGRNPNETFGFQYINAIHPDDREKGQLPLTKDGMPDITKFKGNQKKSGIYCVELRLLNRDGEYRWHLVTFSCAEIEAMSNSIWFGTCTDIHDQKLIQQKLKEAKDAAQRTIESKSRFLSNMSHEIRTPLIGISGMVGFLLDTSLTDEQLDYCHTISSSSEALLMVINDILDLSKVESGKMILSHTWFNVRRLVEEANELLSSMAISKNLELNYIIENNVPSWVKGDRVRLRQVMLNLIGNAIKFTDKGEIFTYCRIKETDSENSSMVMEFSIHDTGRGFTEEDSKRMFQPYSQVHDGFKTGQSSANNGGSASGTGGTGLGLVISRQLIQLHGGELTAKGVKDEGSTFTFTCKVALPTDKDHPSNEEKAKAIGSSGSESTPVKIATDLEILVICPYKYTFESIHHHILMTVADPERCKISQVISVSDACETLSGDSQFTHVVVNINEVLQVVRLIEFVRDQGQKLAKTECIILTTPTQRSKVNKRVKIDSRDKPKVTFLPKPLKPSRYSVVFDPSRIREESRDVKMMNAQQTLESHKSVFDTLSKFTYGKGYRVLLAEDNLVNQKVMSKFLTKAGLKCDVAADGEVCTSKFFEKEVGYYSLILCDLDMPRKDGFTVCQEIRAWEKKMNLTPQIPIVALSAYVMSYMSEKCDLVGFTQYISKPVEFWHLKDMIIEILTAVEAQ